ncbi:unnamed protein product [Lathyrus oleraceus]
MLASCFTSRYIDSFQFFGVTLFNIANVLALSLTIQRFPSVLLSYLYEQKRTKAKSDRRNLPDQSSNSRQVTGRELVKV